MKNLQWTSLALFAFLAGGSAGAQDLVFDAAKPNGYPVLPGIWRLDGIDPELGTKDLEPLRKKIGNASVVALGEGYHTAGGMYVLKHRIFRFLVEKMGFRVFAMEANWQGADVAERYVKSCQGSMAEVFEPLHPVWHSSEVADLLEWMCEWNRSHSNPADKVSFMGFDIQGPYEDGPAIVAFLGRIGIPETNAWVAGIRSCEGVTAWSPNGQIPQARHDACLQALAAVDAHFQSNAEDIRQRTSEQDFTLAKLAVTTLTAYEKAMFIFPRDYAGGFAPRDEAMAHVFQTLRGMRFPGARTAIWAANVHIARNPLPNGEIPMGSYLARALLFDYVSLAIVAYETEVDFSPTDDCGLRDRVSGSVEDKLGKLGKELLFVDTTRSRYLKRGTYVMAEYRVRPHLDYDGILWLKHSARMHPILFPPCP